MRTLDEQLFLLPGVLSQDDLQDWQRGFVLSILKQRKRPNWQPSSKQMRLITILVDDLFCPDLIDQD